MKLTKLALLTSASFIALSSQSAMAADSLADALTSGKASANVNVRYEGVNQDNDSEDATALTAAVRAKYATGAYKGFSAVVGVEASESIIEDYNSTENGKGSYSVVKDPDHIELDQAFLQYKADSLTVKAGRQILTLDNHRHIGHVGWRRDMQTFDALSIGYQINKDIKASYNYVAKRNGITKVELDTNDHLFNVAYTSPIGKVVGYAYLLEAKDDSTLNTFGARYTGASKFGEQKISYTVELATQTADSGASEADANYFLVEAATKLSGIGIKAGYEYLGSDDGGYGFSTPYATGHKFNGWYDQFLGTPTGGLTDLYVGAKGAAFGGKWAVTAHKFNAAESGTGDDYGKEIDAVYTQKFAKKYLAGVKVAHYMANDFKVDTTKLWVWGQVKF